MSLTSQSPQDFHSPTRDEALLLSKINENLAPATWQRFLELNGKRQAETLSSPEYAELLDLINQVELHGAKRLGYLNQLARLRGVKLDEVMAQLGIKKE